MQLTEHFWLEELVHKDIITKLGQERAANLVNPLLLQTLEQLRSKFGPIYINGDFKNNSFINSGIRMASYYKKFGIMYPSFSTHQYGNTVDCKFANYTPIQVYDFILDNPQQFRHVVRLENAHETKTWLHMECGRYRKDNKIEVFNP